LRYNYAGNTAYKSNEPKDQEAVFRIARDGLPLHTDVSEFAEQMEKKYRDSVK